MSKPTELHKNWYCPNCSLTHQSVGKETAFHDCPKLFGLKVPMLLEGVKGYHKVEYREDYLGTDISDARNDSGQVVKSISTEFEDGSNGGTIYLPCATINVVKD